MKNKNVIVLILSYNGKQLLDEAIPSYLENDYEDYSVVVIDNGSTDGTKAYVENRWPEVTVLHTEKNLGYSGGFNFGLDYVFNQCKADYALITNNDVRADSQVIQSLADTAEKSEEIGFVTGKVYFYDYPDILQTVGYYEDKLRWVGGHLGHKEKDEGQFDSIGERVFSDDIFMLVKRNLYLDTQGYDTNFQFQAEQFDWQIRAKKQGYKIYFTPYAKIWHKDSFTIGKTSPFKKYYDIRNSFVVRLKHGNKQYLKKFFKWYLKNSVVIPLLKNTLKGQFRMSMAIFKGFLSALIWGIRNHKITWYGFKGNNIENS